MNLLILSKKKHLKTALTNLKQEDDFESLMNDTTSKDTVSSKPEKHTPAKEGSDSFYTYKIMKVAVVGATGLVGTKMLQVLEERNFPISELITRCFRKKHWKTCDFQRQILPNHWIARLQLIQNQPLQFLVLEDLLLWNGLPNLQQTKRLLSIIPALGEWEKTFPSWYLK